MAQKFGMLIQQCYTAIYRIFGMQALLEDTWLPRIFGRQAADSLRSLLETPS
jgi:hypothetical protein